MTFTSAQLKPWLNQMLDGGLVGASVVIIGLIPGLPLATLLAIAVPTAVTFACAERHAFRRRAKPTRVGASIVTAAVFLMVILFTGAQFDRIVAGFSPTTRSVWLVVFLAAVYVVSVRVGARTLSSGTTKAK